MVLPGCIFTGLFDINRIYLVVFEVTLIPNLLCVGSVFMHCFWCWFLMFKCDLGFSGCCFATVITNFTMFISLHLYTNSLSGEISRAWFLPNYASLGDWW